MTGSQVGTTDRGSDFERDAARTERPRAGAGTDASWLWPCNAGTV
ncbi:hypothetical protein J2Z21_002746 [Streptomyces griseochromogenes]|uniref:Uncharacterized protein n=1 Tax=Streptomyces griseochromogenes TaxID=68214 RepID=A0ABS4LQY6_9ACTN|nr:hypothetical protein [Streptomyces griseochromogenes]MBP2049810.1 hypothetical protein [Streptomyces griseochromogenes]